MFIGIDLGTSAVKVVLVDEEQRVCAAVSRPLAVERPRPRWSEQDPNAWWSATCAALDELRQDRRQALAGVRGIGLSGQMHGATLLDDSGRVLRPAILWNDGRSAEACAELVRRLPEISAITGNLVMPGFTAPKLLWLAEHEPRIFARVGRVLLPKDYLRLRLSGEAVSEMSDASGTLWLDVARRAWSADALEASGLHERVMPSLCEGSEASAELLPELCQRWGIATGTPIAGGAGDQAAGAIGAGVIGAGQAFLALGTSGVLFVAGEAFAPSPRDGVHAFCHGLPGRWHQMAVILSAASCLSWVARLTGARDEAALLAEIEASPVATAAPVFLPYLSGERTPHNDAGAKGVFFGLTHEHGRAELGRAVLEGVAFALADGQAALQGAGAKLDRLTVLGGGARSVFWGRILATALARPLDYGEAAEVGPAFGAARLARLAATDEAPDVVCRPPACLGSVEPDPRLAAGLEERYGIFRRLYPALRAEYARGEEHGSELGADAADASGSGDDRGRRR